MRRIDTSYRSLLRMLDEDGLLTEGEGAVLGRLVEHGEHQALGLMTHEIIRRLAREGRLTPRAGRGDRPGTAFSAADPHRGRIYALPDLATTDLPALRMPLNPMLGPVPAFSQAEIAELFHDQSRRFLSSVARSADLKGVVTDMCDLLRRLLGAPAVLCYTQTLPVPGVIARGLRGLCERLPHAAAPTLAGPESPRAFAATHVRAWKSLVERAAGDSSAALYLPDLTLLPEGTRPLERGSALLVPLQERQPAWSAVLVIVSTEPYAFDQERWARLRLFAPHVRRQFTHAVLLQSVISHDFLTGVYNRAYVEDAFARTLAMAARRQQAFALLIADIDDFKAFNSRYGYDAGDQVLRSVATAFRGALRTTDILARWGGEEFLVLLSPPITREEALLVAERLRSAVERLRVDVPTLAADGLGAPVQVPVTVSLGGAVFPDDGRSRDALWSCANSLLLAAKQEGKNRVGLRAGLQELPRPQTGTAGG